MSNINGILEFVGAPKHMGFVPNKDFNAPWGAIAGGAFVNINEIKQLLH